MPNNLQILAYIQCMKDNQQAKIDIFKALRRESDVNKIEIFLGELLMLEKFIKGSN